MVTCKDCIHNKICGHYVKSLSKSKGIDFDNAIEQYCEISECDNCEYFQNRSKFIELPCEVGDVFYGIDTYGINAYSCYGVGYGYVSANKLGFLLFTVGHREYIFGEEAFLTEAEAKQAQKEREKE